MNLDKELENLQKNPEKELDKMRSGTGNKNIPNEESVSDNSVQNREKVKEDIPNVPIVENGNVKNSEVPNISNAPNASKKGNSGENDEVYKVLEIILSTIISKLKLIAMMPYVFFNHYVKDFLSENSSNEKKIREIRPAVISTILVVGLQVILSFLTKDYSMYKIIPIGVILMLCLMDSDRTRGE